MSSYDSQAHNHHRNGQAVAEHTGVVLAEEAGVLKAAMAAVVHDAAPPNQHAEAQAIELRSEPVQEILSQVPHWPVRWGNTMILVVFVVLLNISWFIRYSDPVSAPVTLTTAQPPARVVAPARSKLARLLVSEKQQVERMAHLGVLENPARYEDMLQLKQWLAATDDALQTPDKDMYLVNLPAGLTLGMVQDGYTAVQQRLSDYRSFVNDGYYAAKLKTLEAQRDGYERLNQTLADQQDIAQQELAIAQQAFEREAALVEKKVLARGQFEQTQAALLQKKANSKTAESTLANNQIHLSSTEGAIFDLVQQHTEQQRTLRLALQEAFNQLKNEVTTWEQTYVLQAPIAGQVTFLTMLHENQFLQMSEAVMAIVPATGEVFGQMLLPQARAGQVRVGQRVRITPGGYAETEVGVVDGVIEHIALAAQDEHYLIRVALPEGLKTSYGIPLDFRQDMQGTAEITIGEQRLLLRVFNWLRFFFEDNLSASGQQ